MNYLPALMGGAMALLVSHAQADVQGWLDFGPDAPGESTDTGHKNWAAVASFHSSQGTNGTKLFCHRKVDKASPRLMEACATGKHFTEVKLDVAKIVQRQQVEFWELTLKDVFVSSYLGSPDGSGGAAEAFCLEWKSLVFTYRVFPGGTPPYNTTTLISPDTDGDGLPDAYEESVGLNNAVSNLNLDSDNDGVSDIEEYRLGTRPSDPTSFFSAVASVAMPDTGSLLLKWPSVAGEEYQIEYTLDLTTPFIPVATVTATSGETTHAVARSLQAGFFRVSKILP